RTGPCFSAVPSGWSSPANTESLRASSTAEKARLAGSLCGVEDFFAILFTTLASARMRQKKGLGELSWTPTRFRVCDHLGKLRFKCPATAPNPRRRTLGGPRIYKQY